MKKKLLKRKFLSLSLSIIMAFSMFNNFNYDVNGTALDFASGFETTDTQPSWTNSVEYEANVTGATCSVVTGQQAVTGIASLKIQGSDNSPTQSYTYFKVFDVNIAVTSSCALTYYIFPEQANGRFVGIDLAFTDGSVLRGMGALDQNGYNMAPSAGHGGVIPLNTWSPIWCPISSFAAGKTVDKIMVAYDNAADTGAFSTYIDAISLTGSTENNISLNKPATVCQALAPTTATSALNNNIYDKWCSTDGSGPHWLTVDLGKTYRLSEYTLFNAGCAGEPAIYNTSDFKVQVSDDGSSFTDIDTVTGNTENIVDRTVNATGRYVRLYITLGEQAGQINQFARINEFELFGTIAAKIVTPVNSSSDIIIADRDVTEFGADKTGTADSTVAIQNAINDCYASGGGTVWMPAGTYKVTGTINVLSFVTLRGDWRDPDVGSGSYGTVISAQIASGDAGPVLFQIGGSGGVMGLTTFYPNQSIATGAPVPYNYTFSIPSSAWTGQAGTQMCSNIINVTMLNSYRGIGVSVANIASVHEMSNIKNIKGTVMYKGVVAYNSSDVSTWENLTFKNSYWANAAAEYNPPNVTTLNTWTRANGVAYTFGDLEFEQIFGISASDYNYGIQIVPGSRTTFCGQILWANITNTNIACKVDAIDTRWGMAFLRSVLTGSTKAIQNNTLGYVKVCDSILTGGTTGTVTITSPGTTPTSYGGSAVSKISRAVLYDVTKAPYNAPYNAVQTGLPTIDATAAIQTALNDAGNAGGGVVYLPAGWYKVLTHLTVPANVELRGSSSVSARDHIDLSYGTVLMAYEGRATATPDTATAFITLNGATSALSGLRILYPENNPAVGTANYPYTVRANGANIYVVNVTILSAYNGLDFGTYTCNNYFIRKVIGTYYKKGIRVGTTTSTTGTIEDCLANATVVTRTNFGIPGWVLEANIYTQIIDTITRVNQTFITINGGTNVRLLNNFTYGSKDGMAVTRGTVYSFNFATDNLAVAGVGVRRTGGTVKVMNYMRYNGANASGTVTFYNPMNL